LKFTALLHHVSIDLLRESYYGLKKQAAPGVDGVTWQEYGQDLEARLSDLHGRVHRGAYHAQPSRRVWGPESTPKADGRKRPLGIAALEDKIVQHAWERFSTRSGRRTFWASARPERTRNRGFRPERGQPGSRWFRGALDALWVGIRAQK